MANIVELRKEYMNEHSLSEVKTFGCIINVKSPIDKISISVRSNMSIDDIKQYMEKELNKHIKQLSLQRC